jgi:Uma2 family endonuclease
MIAVAKIPVRMSVAEFLAWEPGDGQPWQLVDGEPQAMAPTNRTHCGLQSELGRLIGNHLVNQRSPCTILATPGVIPHVRSNYNFRIPDLAVTCSGYEVEESSLTDPVLIVEILSPSNQKETWANVWAYTTIPSVHEILVLNAATIGAELLRRQPDNTWPKEPELIESGTLELKSIDFQPPLVALYRITRLAG